MFNESHFQKKKFKKKIIYSDYLLKNIKCACSTKNDFVQVMASKFSGSNFLELATEYDTWRFFCHQHFWSQSSPCKLFRLFIEKYMPRRSKLSFLLNIKPPKTSSVKRKQTKHVFAVYK
jgi:hypothetical protein